MIQAGAEGASLEGEGRAAAEREEVCGPGMDVMGRGGAGLYS